jgi:hypothetical protein
MSDVSFDSPDPETLLSRRPAARATPGQFDGVGQVGQQFYRQHIQGRSREAADFGWRGAGANPQRAPFSASNWQSDERGVASLSMSRRLDRHYAIEDPDAHTDYERVDGHQQGVLLDSEPATPWKIETLYSSKGSHSAVAQLLGMAGEHSLRTSGRLPKASNDLSVHSSRLVHGLSDKGIIEAPAGEMRNSLDFDDGRSNANSDVAHMEREVDRGIERTQVVSPEEAARGGRMLRQVLRGAKHQPKERWTPETLTESAPLVNARTKAGRFAEFEHHSRLAERADRPASQQPAQPTLF